MHRTVNSDIFVRAEAEQVEIRGQKGHSLEDSCSLQRARVCLSR